jgi:outer membrane protein assembly factor BamA
MERYLFDQGFLKGTVRFGLRCGLPGEADLMVYLEKGPAYRVKDIKVTGNASTADQRWIKRMFKPRVGPVLPIPKRITRKHIDEAKDRVEREYAEPKAGPGSGARRQLELPYPGVRVDTNFDRLEPKDLPPKGRRFELDVDVQLGNGVPTRFLGNQRVTDNRLRKQLQLFKRREPATSVSAMREAENLRNYYQTRGHLFAAVEGKYQDFGTLKQMTFVIDEGPRVRVRGVDLQIPEEVPGLVMRDIQQKYRRERKISARGRFTDADALADLGVLLSAYAERGYLCARAQMRIAPWPEGLDQNGANAVIDPMTALDADGDPKWIESQLDAAGLAALREEARSGVYVRIEVVPGPRVLTSGREAVTHLDIRIPSSREVEGLPASGSGDWGAPRMLRDGSLRRKNDERSGGIPLKLTLDRDVEREISTRYRNTGYPLGDAEVRWVYTDASGTTHRVAQVERLTDPEVGLCRDHAADKATTVDTELYVYEGRRGVFGTTLLRGNFKTRSWVLRREVEWDEGEPYDRAKIDDTRRHIEGTGVVETVQVRERTTDCDLGDDPERPCQVHEVVAMTESKDRLMDLSWGFGLATLDPLYGFLRPSFPNMWGTGWDLQLEGHYGLNLAPLGTTICEGEACYSRSGRASLLRQRIFASPLTFEISGQFQRRLTPARGQIDSGLGQVRFTLPISEDLRFYFGYLIQFANISKDLAKPILGSDIGCGVDGSASCRPPNRREAIVPDRTGALQTGIAWQRVDNAFNPDKGFIANLDFLFAGPYFGGLDSWLRYDLSWQQFIPIPKTNERLNFRYLLRYGQAIPLPQLPGSGAQSIPEVWRYFGGGTADLGVRGVEPQTLLVDIEQIPGPYGATTLRPTAQGGHIRVLGTVALQFVTVRNFLGGKLAHSLFLDLGLLTQRWRHVQPIRDIRRSVGINFIKWNIRIVTVSLGYAVLIPNSIIPRNVRPTDDQNGRFVFDVGATF